MKLSVMMWVRLYISCFGPLKPESFARTSGLVVLDILTLDEWRAVVQNLNENSPLL